MKNNNYGHPDMFSKPCIVTLDNKWGYNMFDEQLIVLSEPETRVDENGNITYIYKVKYKNERLNELIQKRSI